MRSQHFIRFLGSTHQFLACELLLAGLLGVFLADQAKAASEAISCMTGASTQTISYGTVASCTIDFPANDESDVFEFPAAAGDLITLVLTRTAGSSQLCMELEHIFGTDLAGPNCTTQSTRIDWLFTDSGTFSVDVYVGTGLQPTSYTFTLERILPASPSAVEIPLGQARGNEINPAGDVDFYYFNGTMGQNVTVSVFRIGVAGTPCLEAYAPDRNFAAPTICDPTTATRSFVLTGSGVFALMVYSQNHNAVMEYSIQVLCNSGCPVTPQDLTQCLTPRSLQATSPVGGAALQRFVAVGNDDLPNCSLPALTPFTASATLFNGNNWLTVSPASGTFIPGARNTVAATIDPAAAGGAGTYQALILVQLPSLNVTLRIPVTLTLSSGPQISLSWNAFAFQTVENTPAPPPQTLRVYSGLPGTLDWTISAAEPATFPSWLRISPLSGTAGSQAGQGSPVEIKVDPAGLTAGTTNIAYTALVKVTAANASNSPQYVSVTFHVVRITAAPVPLLTGYGLVFRVVQGALPPASQSFGLSNTGGGVVTAELSTTTQTGGNWLTLSKASSTASTATGPDTISVSVNPAGLAPGSYRGKIKAVFTAQNSSGGLVSRPVQECDVVLIVEAPAAPAVSLLRTDTAANGCAPTRMEIVGSTVGTGLNVPVSFPQVLLTQVLDDCGQGVTAATAVAVADGQSVPLSEVGGGLYSGTWTPPASNASATVAFSVFHPTLGSAQQSFTVSAVTASGGTVLPSLFNPGVVEAAGFSQGRPLVPGGILSLSGSNLAPSTAVAGAIPLERKLAGTSVRIGNQDAPLYFVSPGQINAQLPFEAVPGETVAIVVNAAGKLTTPQLYQISPAQPGIFRTATDAAVLDENNQPVTAQNPARIGNVIQIFSSGLGFTDPPVSSGAGSPPSSDVEIPVTVTIGGLDAPVQYQGLAPGFVGLYQVKVVVPQGVTPGAAVPLVIIQDGVPSNPDLPATLPVAP